MDRGGGAFPPLPPVFQAYVMEVAKSLVAKGAQRLVILNTGIQRATGLPLAMVAREIRVQTGTPTMLVSWDDLETTEVEEFQERSWGGHADEMETSIHLFLQPHLVRMDRARPAVPSVSSPPLGAESRSGPQEGPTQAIPGCLPGRFPSSGCCQGKGQ